MPEYIAGVEIPVPPDLGAWPVKLDFGAARAIRPTINVFRFAGSNAKLEQRFVRGTGDRRWRVRASLSDSEYQDLAGWFESADGAYATFTANLPQADGSYVDTTVRFAEFVLTVEHLAGRLAEAGVELAEVATGSGPSYTSSSTSNRFPSSGLKAALLSARQEIIPLLRVRPPGSTGASDDIWVSDRRVTVDGQLYQPRLLAWGPLSQTIKESTDAARFVLGNADSVFTKLVGEQMLYKARVFFDLFHVGSATRLQWWAGTMNQYPRMWDMDFGAGTLALNASDGPAELGLSFPCRQVSTTCWKVFDDGIFCPYAANGTPGFTTCNHSWEDCEARGMQRFHGAIRVKEQLVRIRDNSTGTLGFGRSMFQSSSIVERSVAGRPLQVVYTDIDMPVPCDVLAGRDEGDFYSGLGIVSEGVIGAFSADLSKHKLDDSPPHDPRRGGGWRWTQGTDPTQIQDYTGISQSPWSGPSAFPNSTYSAGVSLAEIRRTDAAGLQLSSVLDRKMMVTVSQGVGGWTWSAPGSRTWVSGLTNPFWIAVNIWLRAQGLFVDQAHAGALSASVMEQYFDVPSAIAAATIADTMVTSLIDGSSEKQFIARGVIREKKPLQQWLDEILSPALGTWTLQYGKLRLGCRVNATVVEAFGVGNVLAGSFSWSGPTPRFNHLSLQFGDQDAGFAPTSPAEYRDETHAKLVGREGQPEYTDNQRSVWGLTRKSQSIRTCSVLAREELGGVTESEYRNHREFSFRSTILAANVEAGMVISYTGPETDNVTIKGRVETIGLADDFSLDLQCSRVTDSMYNLLTGPVAEIAPTNVAPVEILPPPRGRAWAPGFTTPAATTFQPVYSRYFGLQLEYEPLTSGESRAVVKATGILPVNAFVPGTPPPEIRTSAVSSGGAIPGDRTIYVCVAPRSSTGTGPASNIVIRRTPAGSGYQVTISNISWPAGTWVGYTCFAGTDPREMSEQFRGSGLPSSLVVDTLPRGWGRTGIPAPDNKRVLVKVKPLVHAGVAGAAVTAVGASSFTCSDLAGSDNWVGRTVQLIGKADNSTVEVRYYTVTAFNGSTGELTVTESVAGLAVGDVVTILAKPTASSSTTITDAKWINATAPSGLTVDAEIGNLVRAYSVSGFVQLRRIIANTATQITIDSEWDEIPDSHFFIEGPEWQFGSATSATPVANAAISSVTTVAVSIDNTRDAAVLVGAFLLDGEDVETVEPFAMVRPLWVYGGPMTEPSIEVSTNRTVRSRDRVLVAKPGSSSRTITFADPALVPNESVRVIRGDAAAGAQTVQVADGSGGFVSYSLPDQGDQIEVFSDGSEYFVTQPGAGGSSGGGGGAFYAIPSASVVNLQASNGTRQKITLTSDTVMDSSGWADGDEVTLLVIQDGTGGRAFIVNAAEFRVPPGFQGQGINGAPNTRTLMMFQHDGSRLCMKGVPQTYDD
jgi:hypothetical protein